MGDLNVNVTFPGGKKVDSQIGGGLVISTDQSPERGGEGSAPEPFDLFLASIASCAGIFALNFCHSRDLPTEGMNLSMRCIKDPEKKLFSKMILNLELPQDFPEKYRKSIVRAMELCAVKKHMMDAPEFDIVTTQKV